MYRVLNLIFKATVFLLLCITPLIFYKSLGIITDINRIWLLSYHLLLGGIPALIFNIPEWKK